MKTIKKLWNYSCFDCYAFGILIAVELLMSFTFLGYLHIPPISVTIAYLPILAAGCLLSPAHSVVVGFTFGIASMYKASSSYVMPADAIFSPFLSGAPASSLWLSVGTRTLFGLIIGAAFLAARKTKRNRLWIGVVAAISPKVHSLLVYAAIGTLFPELGYRYGSALHWEWDDAVFALICVVTVELLWTAYQSNTMQNIRFCIDQSVDNPYSSKKMNLFFVIFAFLSCLWKFVQPSISLKENLICSTSMGSRYPIRSLLICCTCRSNSWWLRCH